MLVALAHLLRRVAGVPRDDALAFFVKREGSAGFAEVTVPAGASVAMLIKAALAELRLIDVSPDAVTLTLAAGDAPPLDPTLSLSEALAAGALTPRAKLLLSVDFASPRRARIAALPLPPPLIFACEDVGGEEMMVASLGPVAERDATAPDVPFFLTLSQHMALIRFTREAPSQRKPQMLMATGAIKSGKTALVHEIVPRLVVAEYLSAGASGALPSAAPPRRPVFFKYTFPLGTPAADAASDFVRALTLFTLALGLPQPLRVSRTPAEALQDFPHVIEELALRVHASGGVLWLLLDELQAPIVASTPSQASVFMEQFKAAVRLASPCARIVCTGSSMVSLLFTIRRMQPNGFALWDAVAHVSVGREPSVPTALAMAARIVPAYGAAWPQTAKAFLTPQCFVSVLAVEAHSELTSPRPALVAYLAGLCGDAQLGTPSDVFERATLALMYKVAEESTRDTVLALTHMSRYDLLSLRALAVSNIPLPSSSALPFTQQTFSTFAALLCEEGVPPHFLPPYGALFRSWITSSGELAVSFRVEDNNLDLAVHVRNNLKFLADNKAAFSDSTKRAASARVLASLVSNGIGTIARLDGGRTVIRAPATPEEVSNVPAIAGVLTALEEHTHLVNSGRPSSSIQMLHAALSSEQSSPLRASFMADLGLRVLAWVRHFEAHVWLAASHVHRDGLSGAVVAEAVAAAVSSLQERHEGDTAAFTVDASGVLQHASASTRPRRRL